MFTTHKEDQNYDSISLKLAACLFDKNAPFKF